MPTLGLALTWAGYWFLSYGLALAKNAELTLLDLALPSHRDKVVAQLRAGFAGQLAYNQGNSGGKGAGGVTVPLLPGIPPSGPKIPIPGTHIKVQA